MPGLWHDARYGIHLLRRAPGFTAVAVLTIALGIGAATTLFSVVSGVLLKPLPWPEADRLMRVTETRDGRIGRVPGTLLNGTYVAWADHPSTIDGLGGWRRQTFTMRRSGEATRVQSAPLTPSLFPLLEARPLIGRLFAAGEGARGKPGVAILSYGLWQEQFGGRNEIVGDVVQLDDQPYTIVGVMPREFAFPDRDTRLWTAWQVPPVIDNGVQVGVIFSAMARLRRGVTPEQAAAEATSRARGAPDASMVAISLFGAKAPIDVRITPARDALTADVRPALLVLLAAVILLLATAAANVASLQMARATTRRREMAIRAAIGAGAGRLARQVVVESAILGLAGGAAGLAIAAALHRALPWLLPADFPRLADVALDARVVAFAVAITTLTSVACSLWPALNAGRVDLVESLSDAGAAPAGGGVRSGTGRARAVIMTGQIAIACVLLIGAALLTRSFSALLHADRGYDPRNLLTARLPMPGLTLERRIQLLDALAARLRSAPGVRDAGFGNALPLLSAGGFRSFKMRSLIDPSVEVDVDSMQRVVSGGFFAALGLRLIAGRTLADTDTMTSPPVIVVNRSLATKYLGARAVGASVRNLGMCRGNNDRWEVVGVVDDMRQGGVSEPPQPEIFLPVRQIGCANAMPDAVIVVRSAGDPVQHVAPLRAFVREQAPALALDSVMTMEDRLMTNLARPRLYAVVLAGFSACALVIAGVGLFGVLSYGVAQRRREIGVRTALGARQRDIVRLVLGQGMVMAGAGVAAGLAAAIGSARVLSAFLYGVTAHDVWSFVLVPIVLAIVTALACVVPARRAARVDPLVALRS